jgi:hypothetical protein
VFYLRCCVGQAEPLSEDTAQTPTPDAPSIHGPLNLEASQVRISFPSLSNHLVVFLLAEKVNCFVYCMSSEILLLTLPLYVTQVNR